MRSTALDGILQTAHSNQKVMPLYANLLKALQETSPVPYMWDNWKGFDMLGGATLPPVVNWPDGAFCLTCSRPIIHGHRISAFRAKYPDNSLGWMDSPNWGLLAVMVFATGPEHFDVVGLMGRPDMGILFPEAQLTFRCIDGQWQWDYAKTGPVNHYFYDFFVREFDEEDKAVFDHAINYLGSAYSMFLAAWLNEIQQPGTWRTFDPKPPRVKIKGGKIKKLIREPLLGYKVFIPEKT